MGASPAGVHVMRELGLEPDAGALPEERDLESRWQEWCRNRLSGQLPSADGEAG